MKKKIAVLVRGIVPLQRLRSPVPQIQWLAAGKCTQQKTSQTTPLTQPTTRH